MNFVDGTLDRRNTSNVEKFSLVSNHKLDGNRFHSWISTLIKGNVKDLYLCLYGDDDKYPLLIPPSLFTCESLTSLELSLHCDFKFPKYICFPKLKCLKLHSFKFTDECWNQELFSNSPVLEELILNYCTIRMKYFSISIPTLKLLEINTWAMEATGLGQCALKIHAPSLVKFTYKEKEYILSSFPTPEEAVLCLFIKIGCADLSLLLQALAHVKCLTVYDRAVQSIYSADDLSNNSLKLRGVKMLKIYDNLFATDQELIALLKALPNLESLVFQMASA
ncbi:FBD-associated F-box protein At4g10400-like [Papaver somniferum]|uniref:FBD-associated F-box protein At4g10400-like n=1 Tax=Papaver somniferum TaxID=3469 RepID=UPI000E6FE103|nr:FBD-associated F-box protein At4g10400-like [Papaver somniferum]